MYYNTVKKNVEQEHNMWALENSVTQLGRAVQSMWMTDFSDLSTWMTEFSIIGMLCSCVTLGFVTMYSTVAVGVSSQIFKFNFGAGKIYVFETV
jgi:hypothetical protein